MYIYMYIYLHAFTLKYIDLNELKTSKFIFVFCHLPRVVK